MALFYFDINGATAGFTNTPANPVVGTWDTTTANWSSNAAGNVAVSTWVNTGANSVSFGSATVAIAGATGNIASALTFNVNGVTVQNTTGNVFIATPGSGKLGIAAGSVVNVASSGIYLNILAGIVSSGDWSKTGVGALRLTISNTGNITGGVITANGGGGIYLGNATALGAATLSLTNNTVLGTTTTGLTVANGVLATTGFAFDGALGSLTLSGTMGLTNAVSIQSLAGTLTISGIISTFSGTGSISIPSATAGDLVLSGQNTFTGGVSSALASSGALVIGANSTPTSGVLTSGPLGTGTLAITTSGTILDVTSGGAFTIGNTVSVTGGGFTFRGTGNGTLTFNGSAVGAVSFTTTAPTVTVTAGNLIINSVVTSTLRLTKTGAGAMTLAGANSGGLSGGVTLSSGPLCINNATALGAAAGGFIINGGTLDNTSGSLVTNSQNNAITIGGNFSWGGTTDLNLGTGNVGLGAVARTITMGGGAARLTIGGVISNTVAAGNTALFLDGPGFVALNGANTYTGKTVINSGTTVQINNGGATTSSLGAVPATTTADQLTINGVIRATANVTLDAKQGIAIAPSSYAAFEADLGFTLTLPQVIQDGGFGLGLVITPANLGTVVLNGVNTYGGLTLLFAGTLRLGNNSSLGTSTLRISGGTLNGAGSVTFSNAVEIAGGFAWSNSAGNFISTGPVTLLATPVINGISNTLTFSGNIGDAGAGFGIIRNGGIQTLVLSGTNTFTGPVAALAGVIRATNVSAFGPTSATTPISVSGTGQIDIGTGAAVNYTSRSLSLAGFGTGGTSGALTFSNAGSSVTFLDITLTANAGIVATSGNASFNSTNALANGGNTLTLAAAASNTLTPNSLISGTGGLLAGTASFNGTVALGSVAHTFDGQFQVAAGTVTVSTILNAGTPSPLGRGNLAPSIKIGSGTNSATLNYTGTTAISTTRVIDLSATTGTASIGVTTGGGSLTFTAPAFTATGLGAKALSLSAASAAFITIESIIPDSSGGATRIVGGNAAGTVTLSGLSTFTGATTWANGTLSINSIKSVSGGASALGAPTTGPNGTIGLGTGTNTVSVIYTGAGDTSDRTIDLPGGITGAAGIALAHNGTGPLVLTGGVTVTGAGAKIFRLSGTNPSTSNAFNGPIANGALGLSLIKSGLGYWKLGGTSSFAGSVQVNGGLLEIPSIDALGSGTKTITVTTATLGGGVVTSFRNVSILLSGAGVTYPSTFSWSLGNGGYDQVSSPLGAIRATANSTIAGTVTLTGNSAIYADTGDLTLNGLVTGAFTFNVRAAAGRTVTIAGGLGTTTLSFNAVGPGTVVWNGSAANTATAGPPSVNGGTLKMVLTGATGQFANATFAFGQAASQTGSITSRYQYTGGTVEFSNSGAPGAVAYTGFSGTSAIGSTRGAGTLKLSRDAAFNFSVTFGNTSAPANGSVTVVYGGSAGAGTIGTDSSIIISGGSANSRWGNSAIINSTVYSALVPVYLNASRVAIPMLYNGTQTNVLASQAGGTTLTTPTISTSHNLTGDITAQVSAITGSIRFDTGTTTPMTLAAGATLQSNFIMDMGTGTARTIIAGGAGSKLARITVGGGSYLHLYTANITGTGATITPDIDVRNSLNLAKVGPGLMTFTGTVTNLSAMFFNEGSLNFAGLYNNPYSSIFLPNEIAATNAVTFSHASNPTVSVLTGGGATTTVNLNGGDLNLSMGSSGTYGGTIARVGSRALRVSGISAVTTNVQAFQGVTDFSAIFISRGVVSIDPQYGATFPTAAPVTFTSDGQLTINAGAPLTADFNIAFGAITVSAGRGTVRQVTNVSSTNLYASRTTTGALTVTGDATAELFGQNANTQMTFTVAGATTGQPMGNGVNVYNGSNIAFYRAAGQTLSNGGTAAVDTVDSPLYSATGDANFPAPKSAGTSFTAAPTDNVYVTATIVSQNSVSVKSLRSNSSITMASGQRLTTDLIMVATAFTLAGGEVATQTGSLYVSTPNTLSLASNIVDGAFPTKLIYSGLNSLVLTGAGNTYTGGTVINGAGSISISGGSSLGTGLITANGGIVVYATASSAITIANTIAVNEGGLNVSSTGGSAITLAGTITGTGPVINGNAGPVILAGDISGATGRLALFGAGAVTLGSAPAFTSYDFGTNGAPLIFTAASASDISALITPRNANTIVIDTNGNAVTFASSFGNGSTLTKRGDNTLTLGAENWLNGCTVGVSNGAAGGGILAATASGATGYNTLGVLAGDVGSTSQGAALYVSGNITLTHGGTITLGGDGVGLLGVVRSTSGANTISGTVSLSASFTRTTITADSGSTLTFTGGLTGATSGITLALDGVGTKVFTGNITGSNVAVTVATGTARLSGTNTYSTTTNITSGKLEAGSTSALGTSAVTLSAGAILQSLAANGQNGKLTLRSLNNSAGGTIRIGG